MSFSPIPLYSPNHLNLREIAILLSRACARVRLSVARYERHAARRRRGVYSSGIRARLE